MRIAVESTWQRLGGPATIASDADLSDLRRYLDLLETWQVAGLVKDWRGFEVAVDKLYANPSPQYHAGTDSVTTIQIMTIHKSKGLEFDHVILPSLGSQSPSDKKPLLRWQKIISDDNQSTLLMAPLGPHDEEDDPVYAYLKYESNLKTRLEDARVLYVAATRAIKKLYLYAKLTPSKKDGWNAPGKTSLLSPIWPKIEEKIASGLFNIEATADESENSGNDVRRQLVHIRRLPSEFVPPSVEKHALLGQSMPKDNDSFSVSEGDLSIRARHFGTVLHRSLKQIANEGLNAWPESRRLTLPLTWRAQLKELGVLATKHELAELSNAIMLTVADPNGQWILAPHSKAYCEQSLSYSHDGIELFGISVIDRTFIDAGIRWIIDYKFTRPTELETSGQFTQRQINYYKGQLNHYARLYREIGPEPVRCALYFPQIGMFSPVTTE